ncbi:MAG: glycoside hydrolase family 140 protein [Bacteroidetes bacterium]|nr:glycoside hydrolase family 140 protein [Bacteroidota bacterium]
MESGKIEPVEKVGEKGIFWIEPVGQMGLKVSENGRYFKTKKGEPFFWLGDTGWLLLTKLKREEAEQYLEDRRKKGFNVIQVMVVHGLNDADAYGDSALVGKNLAMPKDVKGGYWDHLDWVIDKAAEKGIYIALVPVWGSVVKSGKIGPATGKVYASFLAKRYGNKSNIIWMNGGDIKGTEYQETWNAIGSVLRAEGGEHLITFHPRGRASSSFWFHQQPWLDFNSVQSGHRTYAQDTSAGDPHYGEDNWKYIVADYAKKPVRPVLDAEPSYEQIPYGLHDTTLPRWSADEVRRYGYWSVFAGACGFTYGDNSVMQFLRPSDKGSAYGAKTPWFDAVGDPGAGQMQFLKKLMLGRPFDREPDQSMVLEQGLRNDYVLATRGPGYAFIYTYTGRSLKVNPSVLGAVQLEASWYNPKDGSSQRIGVLPGKGMLSFDPPGTPAPGNDWVLVLDKVK